MTVIILDGEQKSALAAIRSCGRAKMNVIVGSVRTSGMGMHSRYLADSFSYPNPLLDQAGFIDGLLAEVGRCQTPPIVMAFSDATHATLQAYQSELASRIQFTWNEPDAFEIAANKAATYSEAKLRGVPVVPTYLLENETEIRRRSAEFDFPVVVKPRHSVSWQTGVGVFGTASFVHTVDELVTTFLQLKKTTGESPLIQPLIRGEEYGVEMMCESGVVYAEVIHHRVRSMSPTGGASVVRETISIDETELAREMSRAAHKLVNTLQWQGPIMIEFKNDEDSRAPLLMEINGRFWGSLPLSLYAGVDFPLLYCQLLSGNLATQTYTVGQPDVTSRYWLGDVRHLLRVWLRRSAMREHLYPTRRKALRDFFRAYKATKYDVWQWRDPLPALWQYIDVLKK